MVQRVQVQQLPRKAVPNQTTVAKSNWGVRRQNINNLNIQATRIEKFHRLPKAQNDWQEFSNKILLLHQLKDQNRSRYWHQSKKGRSSLTENNNLHQITWLTSLQRIKIIMFSSLVQIKYQLSNKVDTNKIIKSWTQQIHKEIHKDKFKQQWAHLATIFHIIPALWSRGRDQQQLLWYNHKSSNLLVTNMDKYQKLTGLKKKCFSIHIHLVQTKRVVKVKKVARVTAILELLDKYLHQAKLT